MFGEKKRSKGKRFDKYMVAKNETGNSFNFVRKVYRSSYL